MKTVLAVAALVLLSGCATLRPQKGGASGSVLRGLSSPSTVATLAQPENPASASSQNVERIETRQEAAPLPTVRITETPTPAGIVRVTEQFSAPAVLTHTVTERTGTTIGAAQKDNGREVAASLAAMRPVQFAGLAALGFALACFHPVVRAVVGAGKTVPGLAAAGGFVLIFAPQLFAGREAFALVVFVVGLVGAFLLVRLSHKEGMQDASR